jgi:trehalose/maltose hydrolase-like predicted phosphorylase
VLQCVVTDSVLCCSVLCYRFGFGGFGGAMAAWTSAYAGNPFGCCSGSGGFEDCLEHHVSGDIAFSAWQYFSATGDIPWLERVGMELLGGIADFHLARVSPAPPSSAYLVGNTSFHVERVLPIDEWSVGSGCGSEAPGVNDDAQMNGVVKASLLLAAAAARVLGKVSERSLLWDAVGRSVVILYNTTHGHHDQFTSPACPGGWGGTHYTSSAHTVCPTDVEHLTYPLGDVLNISAADSRADAELFFGLTCRENAGMTTPIHTIVWLALGEPALAAAEFNRSMHAAAYGAFNVRNEVDKHVDVPGGHFDNTHFLTGDGGFLQALINGYGGLRITLEGLRLLQPTLPESVGTLALRGIVWRGCRYTINVTLDEEVLSAHSCAEAGARFCVIDANGGRKDVFVGGPETPLSRASFAYPGLLVDHACSVS